MIDWVVTNQISLLSGSIGALLTIIFSEIFRWNNEQNNKKRLLAKDRLEKIYGSLFLIYETNKKENNKNFLFCENEKSYIDKIILKNYYLIEDDNKQILSELYSYKVYHTKITPEEVVNVIIEGFEKITWDYQTKRAFESAVYEIIADNREIQELIKNILMEGIRSDYNIRDEIKRISE